MVNLIDRDKLIRGLNDWALQESPSNNHNLPLEYTADDMIDGINDTNQEELLNASEQIQKVIGRIQKQLQGPLEADLDG